MFDVIVVPKTWQKKHQRQSSFKMRFSGRFSDMWASTRSITRTNPSTFSSQQVSVAWNCFQRSRHKSLQPRWTTTNYDNCKTSKMQRSSSRSHDFDVVQALPHLATIGISKHRRARMQTRKWGTGESCCVEGNTPAKVVDTVLEDVPPWPAKMETKQSEIVFFLPCQVSPTDFAVKQPGWSRQIPFCKSPSSFMNLSSWPESEKTEKSIRTVYFL